MTQRPSRDRWFLDLLAHVELRSTCPRRRVAAIIADGDGRIVSTGYNGSPPGMYHCTDTPCPGAGDQSGDNSRCVAIHAEQNALLQAGVRLATAKTMYCSTTPCFSCVKLILCSPIRRLVCRSIYTDVDGMVMLRQGGVRTFVEEVPGPCYYESLVGPDVRASSVLRFLEPGPAITDHDDVTLYEV